jgi:putative long chain acyl-CoA synthase
MRLIPTPGTLLRPAARVGATAQNALEVIRFGGLETGEEPSPYVVRDEGRHHRLRHYFDQQQGTLDGPAILLVPPLMVSAEVYDVAPALSAVAILHAHGSDPWVIDFGAPDREPGGLERRVADHVLAIGEAVDHVRSATGRDVHLAGYSQGGMFAYQSAAYRRGDGVASVITFGSPADTSRPFGLPEQLVTTFAQLGVWVSGERALPAWAARIGFQLLSPTKTLRTRVDFVRRLHDREALLPRERHRRFLEQEGWVAWPAPAVRDFVDDLFAHNRMLEGGIAIGDRMVTLADIDRPVLAFLGEHDAFAPAESVRAVQRAAPRAEAYEVALKAGHLGLVAGSLASRSTWPTVAAWAHWRDGDGEQPGLVAAIGAGGPAAAAGAGRLSAGLELAAPVGDVARSLAQVGAHSLRGARELTREAVAQFPRLARLEQIQPHTPISLGLLLDEQARRAPDAIFFLYEERGFTHAEVKRRIDTIARGLIAVGVRPGEHVGVLMSTRPTALAVMVALSRLGAVAVLLRPDSDLRREVELGQVSRIIADPEHAYAPQSAAGVPALVLGGGAERELDLPLTDMERIDADAIELPGWFQANPGRAQDLAFILFSGTGDGIRANRISNGRWAMSAIGTASSAALGPRDTVYSLTPHHHASGLLMSIGGAIAGGCRLAMATAFDPATFWAEARRYGVTVTSYTWTLLADLAHAPPNPAEQDHAIRLFIGSGMPKGLWHRLERRFAPARVLEFYASTEAGIVLVNLSGRKPGALGHPLPGSVALRIARYDPERERLKEGPRGFAVECDTDEIGMLVARLDDGPRSGARVLRGIFEPGDAWLESGDLVRRDADGDFWLAGPASGLIPTPAGPVPPRPTEDALGDLPGVGLAVAYAATVGGVAELGAAVTLEHGKGLSAAQLDAALAGLDPAQRPAVVRIVDEIPITGSYRPLVGALQREDIPVTDDDERVFHRDPSGRYRHVTSAPRRELTGTAPPAPPVRH